MEASEYLKNGDQVVFRVDVYRDGDIDTYIGTVMRTFGEKVAIAYLQGYHSRNDDVHLSEVIAVYDKENGVELNLRGASGPSRLLPFWNMEKLKECGLVRN